LIVSNPVLVRRDAATGNLGGVSVELATALAGHLGVPLEPVPYANPARYAESLSREIPWDAGFAARDPARGEFLDFSPNFMEVDNVFLVPAGSRLTRASEVDRPGIRVAVPQGSAPDLFLTRTLRNAEVVRVAGGADQAVEVLASGRADAYGENAHLLHGVMGGSPRGRGSWRAGSTSCSWRSRCRRDATRPGWNSSRTSWRRRSATGLSRMRSSTPACAGCMSRPTEDSSVHRGTCPDPIGTCRRFNQGIGQSRAQGCASRSAARAPGPSRPGG
jgi:hypothetical protein